VPDFNLAPAAAGIIGSLQLPLTATQAAQRVVMPSGMALQGERVQGLYLPGYSYEYQVYDFQTARSQMVRSAIVPRQITAVAGLPESRNRGLSNEPATAMVSQTNCENR
jgi:hypothetical protein